MKFSGTRTLTLVSVAVAAVVLAACGKKDAASDAQVIKIGHVGPVSGAIAHLGKDNENGARMAIEELNAAGLKFGDKAIKFELLAEDDAADPKQGTAAAQKLVDAKVNGVIGHLNSPFQLRSCTTQLAFPKFPHRPPTPSTHVRVTPVHSALWLTTCTWVAHWASTLSKPSRAKTSP